MPGLRHAHTLQQLRDVFGYSPPGECLENKTQITKNNKNNSSTNNEK